MSEKEQALKAAYNAYIDALVDFMGEIKPTNDPQNPNDNAAVKYLLDSRAFIRPVQEYNLSCMKVLAFDTAALLSRKVQ